MTLLAEGEGGARRGRPRAQRETEPTPPPQADAPAQAEQPQAPNPAEAVQEGVKALRGILRFQGPPRERSDSPHTRAIAPHRKRHKRVAGRRHRL